MKNSTLQTITDRSSKKTFVNSSLLFDIEDNGNNGKHLIKGKPSLSLDEDILNKNLNVKKNIKKLGNDLVFIDIPEWQRTKHVHRLHPYLGKFIPQLVETFLKKYFKKGNFILDPFGGSGTTLVEANILGIHSAAIELSSFNALIETVKTRKYDIPKVEYEILDCLKKTKSFSKQLSERHHPQLIEDTFKNFTIESEYLNTWFAERSLHEILFYRSIITEYENQDVLKVILSRSARSCRLISHFDLARPKEPIKGKYWCLKHSRMCEPIQEALKFINRYSLDTITRLKEFDKLRTKAKVQVFQGDGRTIELSTRLKFDGIFTSPPYVGMIDYHDQHNYAYELFNLPRNDHREIGPTTSGRGKVAQKLYQDDIAQVFMNIDKNLKPKAKIFIVANDVNNLYPEIANRLNYRIVDVFHRPVSMRTQQDSSQYFESIFYLRKI